MTRVKGGKKTRRRHRKVLKLAKGYWQSRSKLYKKAKKLRFTRVNTRTLEEKIKNGIFESFGLSD